MYAQKEKIYLAYVSKHNSNREKQDILLVIPNREGRKRSGNLATGAKFVGQRRWYYLIVKKLSALLRRITSKH